MKSFTQVTKENKQETFMSLAEAAYAGNIGYEEMVKFYRQASPAEEKEMDKILKKNDVKAFRKIIERVLGIKLKA